MIFYDFEVFKEDWLVVLINPDKRTEDVIINNPTLLTEFYEANKDEIWVGKNNTGYDQFIMKAILCGFNPKKVNDWIIIKDKSGWKFSSLLSKIPMINYDIGLPTYSLKQLEGFMGNTIKETSVPFDIDRKLTNEEIEETVKYCKSDVYNTIQVFMYTINEFNAQLSLIREFNLPLSYISKTQAQLASIILGAERVNLNDEWDIRVPDTIVIDKHKYIVDWFLNEENHKYDASLTTVINGVEHNIALGGIHGAVSNYSYTCKKGELLIMADVDQLYPTIMIKYGLLSRAVKEPEKFKNILDTSLRLKAEKKKKEREPYKRICNITYGAEGDKYNAMYDPLHRNLVCIFGQLFIIDLLEKVEPFTELIQSNTDGIFLKIKESDFDLLDDVVYEWEQRTCLHMSFDLYKSVYQKDVNNYIVVDFDGNTKRKGTYVKELNELDNNLPIVNKAIVDYITKQILIEDTVNNCNDLKQFQMICKITNKYKCLIHNNVRLSERCVRVFASKYNDGGLYKLHKNKTKPDKFPSTPVNCFIDNDDVNGKSVPDKLDRQFYINMAKERVQGYGI